MTTAGEAMRIVTGSDFILNVYRAFTHEKGYNYPNFIECLIDQAWIYVECLTQCSVVDEDMKYISEKLTEAVNKIIGPIDHIKRLAGFRKVAEYSYHIQLQNLKGVVNRDKLQPDNKFLCELISLRERAREYRPADVEVINGLISQYLQKHHLLVENNGSY